MGRGDAKVTTVGGTWLKEAGTQKLFQVYREAGFQLLAVGGCVRNDLLGQPVADVDMASDAPPDVATKFLEAENFRVIPTGFDHGTITVISDGTPFEITTFRKDIDTDGRRATVAFSTRLEDDAARRDFTINALYADDKGQVIDPESGLKDIAARQIRFIGSAQDRIREDYLRTLRFFRFHAWYADPNGGFDSDALAAISAELDGLDQLSRERVGAELIKLLSAPDPAQAVMVMAQSGALMRILPGSDPKALGPLVHLEGELGLTPNPIRRLASIALPEAAKSLRLSKAQMRDLAEVHRFATSSETPGEMGYRLGRDTGLGALALRHALFEQPFAHSAVEQIERGAVSKFPIKAKDLSDQFSGLALGEKLRALEAEWIASGFTKTKPDLLG